MDPAHVQLRQLQYSEAEGEEIVDQGLDFPHLETPQLLFEDFEIHAMWLFEDLLPLLLACVELDVGQLLLVLAAFSIYLDVHQLENSLSKSILAAARNVVLFSIYGGSHRDCCKRTPGEHQSTTCRAWG